MVMMQLNRTSNNVTFIMIHTFTPQQVVAFHMAKSNSSNVSSVIHQLLTYNATSPMRGKIALNKTLNEGGNMVNYTTKPQYYVNLRTWDHLDGAVRSQIYFNQYNHSAGEFIGWLGTPRLGGVEYGEKIVLEERKPRDFVEDDSFKNHSLQLVSKETALVLVTYNFTNHVLKVICQHTLNASLINFFYLTDAYENRIFFFLNSTQVKANRFYGITKLNKEEESILFDGRAFAVIEMSNGDVLQGLLFQTDSDVPPDIKPLDKGQVAVLAVGVLLIFLVLLIGLTRKCIVSPILKKREKAQQDKKKSTSNFEA